MCCRVSSLAQAKRQPKNYNLSDRQLDGILQLAQAGAKPPAAAPLAAAPLGAPPTPLGAPPAPPRPAAKLVIEQLRTTLWDTVAKKRIPATAYQGDMAEFLARNPHLEVYNRQDRVKPQGQTLMAGMRISTFKPAASGAEDLRVVVWHTQEHRKLTREESPTQAQLCKFLQDNPLVVVYEGQQAPAPRKAEPQIDLKKAAPVKLPLAKPAAVPQAAVTAGQLMRLAGGAPEAAPAQLPGHLKKPAAVRWKSLVALQAK